MVEIFIVKVCFKFEALSVTFQVSQPEKVKQKKIIIQVKVALKSRSETHTHKNKQIDIINK